MLKTPAPSVDRVKVAVRVRPFSQREKNSGSKCVISMHSRTTTTIQDPKNPEHMKTFTFDLAYWSHDGFQRDKDGVFISSDPSSAFAGQGEIFQDLGRGILDSAWQGYNATLLAYGQTGSGKSYSMLGFGANKGIIPNVCEELFRVTGNRARDREYQGCVTFSMLEIYNEQVRDLLSGTKKRGGLRVREDQQLGFYVDGLRSVPCDNYAQIERLMEQGTRIRTTAATNMNARSSRSHMVITIQVKQVFLDRDFTKQSSINLVDLAGSERQKSSGSEGDRLREGSRVNLSLTNLGNVISALAEAATGKTVLHIPYRDSVLTKLLQSALGGNSRTALLAAISPADICYEETLSTLRYAERAKKIQNKAVVNTSTLRRQSRAENTLLLVLRTCPHLRNVNEDAQLSGALRFVIRAGTRPRPAPRPPPTAALRISDTHVTFTNSDGQVTVTPHSGCKVAVNGVPVATTTKLQHLDRIILGSSSAYLYVGFPSERGGEDLSRFDYDFFQQERAAAEGVSVHKLGAVSKGDGRAEPSVLAVFQDYIKLMPLVAEANQMSDELKKGLKLELKVKNLASSDSRGCDLQKEVMVKVTHQVTHAVWIWSKAKFINRKFLMEELYQRFLDGEGGGVALEDDPFWDPPEAVPLGSAHIWLQPLAHCMKLEEQVEFLNCDGLDEAVLCIHITPCSPTGRPCAEDDVVTDPLKLLGKRMDFQIRIVQCLGTKWLKADAARGVQMGYRVYDLPRSLYTRPVWKTVNPQIQETVQFTAFHASRHFLNYLQTHALIVELWGLQEGCVELGCSRADFTVTGEGHIVVDAENTAAVMEAGPMASDQLSELSLKLLGLEQETELLRNINRALREENVRLRESLGGAASGQQAPRPPETLEAGGVTTHMATAQAGCDRELARALQAFYQSMSAARGQLLTLRRHKPPEDDQMLRPFVHRQSQILKDFGELLESSLWKLKNDVALIVKKKREHLQHPQ
ncbi:PREDICTED: kinesin-like protein KIF28P [Condylura cristata]|uniref:kinesin-like protein KIF28P n=1 Tax=Condylura cristata TaxID=143302 RepID=UPI000642BF2F|nr:PREDICTED: kinesin-like protein KIF28P [Condylura cristata]